MKKTTYLLLLAVALTLIGCGKKTHFTLKGKIAGLVHYQLPDYKLDTILTKEGEFTYTFQPDTFTIFSLVIDSTNIYPIYADKGEEVEINGAADSLIVKGNGDNQTLAGLLTR